LKLIKKETCTLKKLGILKCIIENKFEETLELPKIYDLVFEEGKKEEKKPVQTQKVSKKGKVEEEEKIEEPPHKIDYTPLLHKGPRKFTVMPFFYNIP